MMPMSLTFDFWKEDNPTQRMMPAVVAVAIQNGGARGEKAVVVAVVVMALHW